MTDYLDVLVREGWEKQVAVVGAWAVRRIVGWRVADLQELRPQAAAWSVFGGWTGPRAAVWQSSCPIIEIRPWDELLASLSKNLRSSVRRALRLAEAEGLRRELVGAEGAEEAARGVVALHRTTWEGRAIGPEHLTHRFEEYIATAARRMTARGLGGISELRLDAEPFISTFAVFGRDFLGTYMIGASAEALAKYQWSSLYIWDALDVASHRNVGRLDLLRGEERYKLRWSSEVVANRRLILGRDPLSWGLYAAYHALRLKLRHYVRSERAPRWLREAIDRYRTLKSTAARVYSKRPGRP